MVVTVVQLITPCSYARIQRGERLLLLDFNRLLAMESATSRCIGVCDWLFLGAPMVLWPCGPVVPLSRCPVAFKTRSHCCQRARQKAGRLFGERELVSISEAVVSVLVATGTQLTRLLED